MKTQKSLRKTGGTFFYPPSGKDAQTTPAETEVTAADAAATGAVETTPETTEAAAESDAAEAQQPGSSTAIWIVAGIVIVGGLGATAFLLKKKST